MSREIKDIFDQGFNNAKDFLRRLKYPGGFREHLMVRFSQVWCNTPLDPSSPERQQSELVGLLEQSNLMRSSQRYLLGVQAYSLSVRQAPSRRIPLESFCIQGGTLHDLFTQGESIPEIERMLSFYRWLEESAEEDRFLLGDVPSSKEMDAEYAQRYGSLGIYRPNYP